MSEIKLLDKNKKSLKMCDFSENHNSSNDSVILMPFNLPYTAQF